MERRERFSKSIIAFFLIATLWVSLLFLAPLALPSNSIQDLSGGSLMTDNEDLINEMPQPWNGIYLIGDVFCHQIAERSFSLNGNQLPFCARCMGIWLGLAVGLVITIVLKFPLDMKFLALLVLGLIPLAIDGTGQFVGLWESTNTLRMITGLITGIITGIALGVIIDELKSLRSLEKTKTN